MNGEREQRGMKGRGAGFNPGNRFEKAHLAPDPDPQPPAPDDDSVHLPVLGNPASATSPQPFPDPISPPTTYLPDHSRSVIATNSSPDIPFSASINPYRGCSHGCIYCYARPTHEYLGFSAGLDFESKILVKHDAPELLRAALASPKWQPQVIAMSGVTDCYQPAEAKFKITRGCLEVLLEFRNPVGIITKNHLVTRDLDILRQLAALDCVQVSVSITTLRPELTRILEPRTSVPRDRLRAIRELADAGIPVNVMVAPVIPALTDHEMPAILEAARDAGARSAGFTLLRLPFAVKDLFTDWLDRHFPDRKNKVLNRIRDLRGQPKGAAGKLNDPNFHSRMRGQGAWADQMSQIFKLHTTRLGLNQRTFTLSTAHFRRPAEINPRDALPLFDG